LFLGEVGVTQDQTPLTALDRMLTYMQQHTDVWQGVTYWAGGPLWNSWNYMFSIEPQNGVDKRQMGILVGHETAPTATTPVVAPNNSSILGSRSNPVAASTLFTASDQDGDSIVQYDFWGSGTAGGHWLINNTALVNGQDNFVDAAQLSQVTYQGGAGTETVRGLRLRLRACSRRPTRMATTSRSTIFSTPAATPGAAGCSTASRSRSTRTTSFPRRSWGRSPIAPA
jgi:hypothetical protein